MEERCFRCDKTFDDTYLRKCPVCFKFFCEEHSHTKSGRPFCSRDCALYFFTSDEED